MMNKEEICARIGMVNYINTAPIHETWKERVKDASWRLVEATPAALNDMLASGAVDLGFVSSHEYGVRPEKYQILSDLSISANGAVGSVFLFSRIHPEKLSGSTVLLSSQSKTSIFLVKIILEQFFEVSPGYIEAEVREAGKNNAAAILAIGDDAIRLKREGAYRYCLDLGEVWLQYTGLPFVFAVCAVREDFLHLQRRTDRSYSPGPDRMPRPRCCRFVADMHHSGSPDTDGYSIVPLLPQWHRV